MSTGLLLRRLLEQPCRSGDPNLLLVLDTGLGEGTESDTESDTELGAAREVRTAKGVFGVGRAGTEIELRHALWQAGGEPLVVFLPDELAHRLPADLLLTARNQRVQALSADEVLSAVLGAEVRGATEPHLESLALAQLDRLRELAERTFPSMVGPELLSELLLEACDEERVLRAGAAGELLASWLAAPPEWSDELRRLIVDVLPRSQGPDGRLLAWGLGEAGRLEPLVIHGALLAGDADEVSDGAWGPLAAAREALDEDAATLRRVAAGLATAALEALGSDAAPYLRRAEEIGRQVLRPSDLVSNRLLPLAFETRCHELAGRIARGEAVASDEVAELSRYRAATRDERAVIEAMARLSCWLAEPEAEGGDVLERVERYQSHGAFADLAASRLRRALARTQLFHAEADPVLERYRARRDQENEAFAACLAETGYEAALHHRGIVPLHKSFAHLLGERPAASGIYLAVLDGCSYAVFLEILAELASDGDRPLGLEPDADGNARGAPALAPLPSVTSQARGALFLGAVPGDALLAERRFRDDNEPSHDKKRLEQNAALGDRDRVLFLKGDLADGGQGLFAALGDPTREVVAAVFNDIDDQISSARTGLPVRVLAREIPAFQASLEAALDAGREIWLTADHGHSPFFDRSLRVGPGSTPRFLELRGEASVPEGFAEIDLGGLSGPLAGRRAAFAWRLGAYRGSQQAGFHGGCGLEELAVPLARLVADGLPADAPSWWRGLPSTLRRSAPVRRPAIDAERAAVPAVPALVAASVPPPAPPPPRQRHLFEHAEDADLLGLPASLEERLSATEKAVLVLLRQNQSARLSELAEHLDRPLGRLSGLMSKLERRLGESGLRRFERQALEGGEWLYRYVESED